VAEGAGGRKSLEAAPGYEKLESEVYASPFSKVGLSDIIGFGHCEHPPLFAPFMWLVLHERVREVQDCPQWPFAILGISIMQQTRQRNSGQEKILTKLLDASVEQKQPEAFGNHLLL